jgi:hypothetical protein
MCIYWPLISLAGVEMKTSKIASMALLAVAVLLGSTASAQAKPKVAVLGLEVSDDGGSIDAQIAQFATELTTALRQRAKDKDSPFQLAPNSNKDLLEMKLLSGCANEARGCMADIGKELKADRLIYGKIERRKDGYHVTLKLLNVSSKKMERNTSDTISINDSTNVDTWSRRLYNRLGGLPDQGTLMVKANVDRGTVYVNGESKGELSDGSTQILGLPEGKHEVRVESEGNSTFTTSVTIRAGQTADLTVNLAPIDTVGARKADKGPSRPGGTARILFWTTAVTTAGGAAGFTLFGLQMRDQENAKSDAILAYQQASGMQLSEANACTDAEGKAGAEAVVDACDKGKSAALVANVSLGVGIASALAAGYFYYKGYVVPGKSKDVETAGRDRKTSKPVVEVSPVVSPGYAGAGVKIEF